MNIALPLIEQHICAISFLEAEVHKLVGDAVVSLAGHFASETLGRDLIGIEGFYFGVVKQKPFISRACGSIFYEAVVVATVCRTYNESNNVILLTSKSNDMGYDHSFLL